MKTFLLLIFFITSAQASPEISVQKCLGDEFTAAKLNGLWADYRCQSKEWLITINSPNIPFVGKLKISPSKSTEFFDYYNIIPTIPVAPQIRWILRQYQVQISINGEILVVHK